MNYITEIKSFYDWLETNTMTTSGIALWHALMHINNKTAWSSEFGVAMSVLEIKTGLKRATIKNARNNLVQAGRITYKERSGGRATMYKINPFSGAGVSNNSHDLSQEVSHDLSPLNKLNKTKQNKYKPSRFAEFWSEYPKKDGKAEGLKAYEKACSSLADEEKIISILSLQKKKWEREEVEPKYIPRASTWLNQKRYEDDFEFEEIKGFKGWDDV